MKIDAAVCSNMGRVRKNNEDNFYFDGLYMDEEQRNEASAYHQVNENSTQIYAVCDGMGGEEGGEDASIAAVRGLKQYARQPNPDDENHLREALQEISDGIDRRAQEKGFHSGTTIAMLVFHQNKLRAVHVGDSRVYGMANHKLRRMTVDHSEVQRMFSMGLIREEDMDTHPRRHVILQYLGMPREDALVSPTVSERENFEGGMKYVICSDGLTDMVKDPEIAQILDAAKTPEEAAKQLTMAALRNGGRDNVTVICLFTEESKEKGKKKTDDKKARLKKGLALAGLVLSGMIALAAIAMFVIDYIL